MLVILGKLNEPLFTSDLYKEHYRILSLCKTKTKQTNKQENKKAGKNLNCLGQTYVGSRQTYHAILVNYICIYMSQYTRQ